MKANQATISGQNYRIGALRQSLTAEQERNKALTAQAAEKASSAGELKNRALYCEGILATLEMSYKPIVDAARKKFEKPKR